MALARLNRPVATGPLPSARRPRPGLSVKATVEVGSGAGSDPGARTLAGMATLRRVLPH